MEEMIDQRELSMYRREEAVKALLDNSPIKQIACQLKIAKNQNITSK